MITNKKDTKNTDLFFMATLVAVLSIILVPLPSVVLDFSLTLSFGLSLLVLFVALNNKKTLDFNSFPSLLLMITFFRLSLNVASTRLILSKGHSGEQSVGAVISAFGDFVIGNNYVIGAIIFAIVLVINFIVITKGAGRVAEVGARFALDALPGKQMSIDSDLNAEIITKKQALQRRKELEQEANFYGAMDGASKFVRGDAIASVVIIFINIIGGIFIGVFQKNLDAMTAIKTYTQLTIGDGLVNQIPALMVSVAAGIVVTRSNDLQGNKSVGSLMLRQLTLNSRLLYFVSATLVFMSFIEGLPMLPFFFIGAVCAAGAWGVDNFHKKDMASQNTESLSAELSQNTESLSAESSQSVELLKDSPETRLISENKPKNQNSIEFQPLRQIQLEVGLSLIDTIRGTGAGSFQGKITNMQERFLKEVGVIIPAVYIKDNMELKKDEYRLLIKGHTVAEGTLKPHHVMVVDGVSLREKIPYGQLTQDPVFGLEALWVHQDKKEDVVRQGFTTIEPSTVIVTHINEMVRAHILELFGRQEASMLIESFKHHCPKVIEELIPEKMQLGEVTKILQNLLSEQISIRDLLTIFETLADNIDKTKSVEELTQGVRQNLLKVVKPKKTDKKNEKNLAH